MPDQKRPTIRDVAATAKVSHQTVSRVINGDIRVSASTRAKVEATIAALGYHPNAIARSMARGRTHILACLSPNLVDYTFASLIESAEVEARKQGYFLLASCAPDTPTFAAIVDDLISHSRVDGLIIINPYADDRYTALPLNVPMVFVGAHPRTENVSSVRLEDESAARQATQHLIERGHQHIAMITGPLIEDCTLDRIHGHRLALTKAGFEVNPQWVAHGDWSSQSGYEVTRQFLAQTPRPSAIFAQNDRMALGALRAARDVGLNVPGDLAVIGIDDMPMTAYFDPPLTTLRQNMTLLGQEAARLLIHSTNQPQAARQHLRLPAELIIRNST